MSCSSLRWLHIYMVIFKDFTYALMNANSYTGRVTSLIPLSLLQCHPVLNWKTVLNATIQRGIRELWVLTLLRREEHGHWHYRHQATSPPPPLQTSHSLKKEKSTPRVSLENGQQNIPGTGWHGCVCNVIASYIPETQISNQIDRSAETLALIIIYFHI